MISNPIDSHRPHLLPRLRVREKFEQMQLLRKIKVSKRTSLAVVVHLYYPEIWPTISNTLKKINVPFDLYVSVQKENNNPNIKKINEFHGTTNILVYPNKGRDVLPFLHVARILKQKRTYKYLLKLHTKKSPHRKDGDDWMISLLDELVPDDISPVIEILEKNNTGVVGPSTHLVSLSRYLGDNRKKIETILNTIAKKDTASEMVDKASLYPFFGGTMFWARLDIFTPILNSPITPASFENEAGQVDGTTAHALERVFGGLLHQLTKRKMYTVGSAGVERLAEKLYEDEYRYVG